MSYIKPSNNNVDKGPIKDYLWYLSHSSYMETTKEFYTRQYKTWGYNNPTCISCKEHYDAKVYKDYGIQNKQFHCFSCSFNSK